MTIHLGQHKNTLHTKKDMALMKGNGSSTEKMSSNTIFISENA